MPVAYSYIRFSTVEQIKGDSLRRQTTASVQYAAANGLELDTSLNAQDLGVSAFSGANFESGALGKFITAIDEGRVARGSYLLVESLDRLSRLPVPDALAIFQAIIGRGVVIVTLTDMAVYSQERLKTDWTPLLIALVSMSRAHEESAVKSQRVKAAWDAKKERVKNNKEVMSTRCPWWLKPSDDKTKYEIIEANAETVRLMYALAKDGMGSWSISRYLNALEIPTPQHSQRWQNSTVQFNLRNIATIGILQMDQDHNGRTTTNTFVEDYYPTIIDKTLFYEVQTGKAERRRMPASGGGRTGQCHNIFKGTAKCGYCGSPMHIRRKPGINTGFLYCAKSLQSASCVGVSYNVRQLEAEFVKFTRELDLKQVLGEGSGKGAVQAKKSELAACAGELEATEAKFKNLLKAVELGGDVSMLVQRMREMEHATVELKKRRHALQAELQSLISVEQIESSSYENMSALMEQLESKSTELDEKLRLRFRMLTEVQRIVKRLYLFPGGAWHSIDEVDGMAAGLREAGYDEDRIEAYISSLPTKPNRDERYFVASMRNGMVRTVKAGDVIEVDTEWTSKALERLEARRGISNEQ
ncbi:recombinase family protein [Duganella sp. FT50W]|uniref:Recombinase family protein n=1 Tax=Duganella lactea TaxID=2692173 RepID=A0A6L8MIZ8_9BURK|nr:recombinase family protein [Duganella lactea]MYM81786.1 recombinase family protein [Duganella lactea]